MAMPWPLRHRRANEIVTRARCLGLVLALLFLLLLPALGDEVSDSQSRRAAEEVRDELVRRVVAAGVGAGAEAEGAGGLVASRGVLGGHFLALAGGRDLCAG